MSAPSIANGRIPTAGGSASVNLGGLFFVTSNASAASISGQSLSNAFNATAAFDLSTFSHLLTTANSRCSSIFCFSTFANASRRLSSLTIWYRSKGTD